MEQTFFPDYRNYDNEVKTLGMLDTSACIMYLNCTREEYQRDYLDFCNTMEIHGNMQVFFHELTHYFQVTTTTNGAYLLYLEDFQFIQVQQILRVTEEIRCPIISDLIKNHDMKHNPHAWYHLRKWYAAELLKSLFNGDFKRYDYLRKNTVFSEERLSDIFMEIDVEMCHTLQRPVIRKNVNDEKRMLPDDLMHIIRNASSPYENHARMAEFWWMGKTTENPYKHKGIDLFSYSAWIEALAERVEIYDFQDFVSSFLAICELAQFAPVMPGSKNIKETSIYDFLPIYRMGILIDIAKDIPPVNGINDYDRYVDDLAKKAGFTEVADICKDILADQSSAGKSFWTDLFYDAIKTRNKDFSTFSYYGLWHPLALSVEPLAESFIQRFNPPIVCYKDSTFCRKNSVVGGDETFSLICRDVFRKYIFMIMTGYNVRKDGAVYINSPIVATELERQYIEYKTGELIEKRLNIIPNLRVI